MYEPETVGEKRFRVVGTSASPQFVFAESNRIDECVEFAAGSGIGIAIAPLNGFHLPNLEFLRRFPFIDRLAVFDAGMMEISAINSLHKLHYLQISGKPRQQVFVENFPVLEELRVQWWAKFNMKVEHPLLRSLSLRNYADKKGLAGMPNLPSLLRFNVAQSSLSALSGIEKFLGLSELTLTNLPRLASVAPLTALQSGDISTLEIDKCQGISDHETIRVLKKLRRLAFNECGEINSLRFLNDLPLLESFSFVGTTICDGDLSPCLRLRFVGFDDNLRYSHRSAVFKERLQPEKSGP